MRRGSGSAVEFTFMNKKLTILKEVLGAYYCSRDEYLFKCPYCEHSKKKLSVNIKRNFYKCWVCDSKGRDIRWLVKKFGTPQNQKEWSTLNNQVDMSDMSNLFEKNEPIEEKQRLKLPDEFVFLGGKKLTFESRRPIQYLKQRGVTLEDVRYYKLGYCSDGEYRNRVIIPSFDDEGYCNYFVGRAYTDDWMKYKNPKASRDIIFNELLVDWREPVILVEGPFDAIKARNSIPILGSTLNTKSKLFSKLVEKSPQVYIAFDNDALQKSLLVVKNMIEYGLEVYRMDTSNIEDIGSLSSAEVEKLKQGAKLMNFENLVLSSYF